MKWHVEIGYITGSKVSSGSADLKFFFWLPVKVAKFCKMLSVKAEWFLQIRNWLLPSVANFGYMVASCEVPF